MAKTLTALSVLKLKAGRVRLEIPDAGCPGLRLIIQPLPSGSKSWAMRFRRPDGKSAKLTLGPLDTSGKEVKDEPRIGYPLTLAAAHALATDIKRQRARDVDVVAETNADRKRRRDENIERSSNTFGSIAREFFVKHRTKKWAIRPRRWRSNAATLGLRYPVHCDDPAKIEPEEIEVIKGSVAARWADKPIAAIDKYAVEEVIEDAFKQSDSRARKLYSVLSVLFGWLPLKYRMGINPMIGVRRPGPPKSRDRKLDNNEIILFWKACDAIDEPKEGSTKRGIFGALYKVLLLTGCRLREPAGMDRTELGDNNVWEVPGDRTKNHLPFLVPLPPLAVEIINRIPVVGGSNSGLIFTTNGKTAVSGFSKAKKALDTKMAEIAAEPISPWRVHDLRRTFSTTLNESPDDGGLGIAPHVVEACLNHISGGAKSGVAGTYNKAKYLSEKRVALERWANHIEGLVAGRKAKVVSIGEGRR